MPTSGNYRFELWGAEGGASANPDNGSSAIGYGGKGGYVKGEYYLTAGSTIYIYVGGKGESSTSCSAGVTAYGGFNGGGNSTNYPGGGGGGATDVRIGGSALANRVIVAAGAGGGAHGYAGINGGAGGGATGQAGLAVGDFSTRSINAVQHTVNACKKDSCKSEVRIA